VTARSPNELAVRAGVPAKVRPEPDDPAPEDLVSMLELPRVGLETGVDWQTHARALRVWAESLGRIAETEGDVFHRFIELPRLEAGLSTPNKTVA
jgi:hypothetical protein